MKNEFVTYEQALALKELGFDEPCLGYWRNEDLPNPITIGQYTTKEDMEYEISGQDEYHNFKNIIALAPLYQQAFRWFREKYSLHSHISKYKDNNFYHYDIFVDEVDEDGDECFETYPCNHLYNSYEEAESTCLDKLIEIAKTNK